MCALYVKMIIDIMKLSRSPKLPFIHLTIHLRITYYPSF